MSNSAWRKGDAHLVLDDLDLHARPDHGLAFLERRDPADVDRGTSVELERPAAGGRLGAAEHDADLFADLVDEDQARLRLGDDRRQLAERLAHQARLQSDVRLADLAVDLRLRHEGGDRVDDDDVDGVRVDQHLGDLQGLFAVVRLAKRAGCRCRRRAFAPTPESRACSASMNAAIPPVFWACRDDLEREGRLAGRFGAEHLDRRGRAGCRRLRAPRRPRASRSESPASRLPAGLPAA